MEKSSTRGVEGEPSAGGPESHASGGFFLAGLVAIERAAHFAFRGSDVLFSTSDSGGPGLEAGAYGSLRNAIDGHGGLLAPLLGVALVVALGARRTLAVAALLGGLGALGFLLDGAAALPLWLALGVASSGLAVPAVFAGAAALRRPPERSTARVFFSLLVAMNVGAALGGFLAPLGTLFPSRFMLPLLLYGVVAFGCLSSRGNVLDEEPAAKRAIEPRATLPLAAVALAASALALPVTARPGASDPNDLLVGASLSLLIGVSLAIVLMFQRLVSAVGVLFLFHAAMLGLWGASGPGAGVLVGLLATAPTLLVVFGCAAATDVLPPRHVGAAVGLGKVLSAGLASLGGAAILESRVGLGLACLWLLGPGVLLTFAPQRVWAGSLATPDPAREDAEASPAPPDVERASRQQT